MTAIAHVGASSGEIAAATALVRSGVAVEDACRSAGISDDGAVRAAMDLSSTTGAPIASILQQVGQLRRNSEEADAHQDAILAGPRVSATILQWLPLLGVGISVAVEPSTVQILATTPVGWFLLGIALALICVGRVWTARLVDRAVQASQSPEHVTLPLMLVEAALKSGLDLASALRAAGAALGAHGDALTIVAAELSHGTSWPHAWARAPMDAGCIAMEKALRVPVSVGASPTDALDSSAQTYRAEAAAARVRAAGRLGVYVTVPLALCFMPAFVLVGVIPLMIAVASGSGISLT